MDIRGANASAIIRGINEKQCVDFCAKNRDHKSRTVLCASVVYEREAEECRMYRRASFPDGEMVRRPEDGRRYFEKFCLPEDIPVECAQRQFVRVDDFILKGYAQSTTTVPTMAECVAYCMREREFECKSAMYFYEEGECITNVESAITAPDDFQRPDDGDKVVFFHNGCVLPGAGTAGQPGEFELAQSQDPTTPAASLAQEEQSTGTEEGKSTASSSSFYSSSSFASSSSPQLADGTQSDTTATNVPITPGQESTPNSTPPDGADPTPNSSSGGSQIESSTILPEMASEGITEKGDQQKEEEGDESGQKLEETAAAATEPIQFGPKAVPIPPAATEEPEQAASAARLHPKQLALEKSPDVYPPPPQPQEETDQQLPQRQYGAKTIERASDGSFQEKGDSAPSNGPAKGPLFVSRKGPESTKRLHLKLIKEQQPKLGNVPDASSDTLVPPKQQQSLVPVAPPPSSTENNVQVADEQSKIPANLSEQPQQQSVQEQSAEERFEGTEGYFSHWGPWTPCHVPGERRVRRRKCLDLRRCKGALMQVDYCPRDIPPPPSGEEIPTGPQADEASIPVAQPEGTQAEVSAAEGPSREPVPPPINNLPQVNNGGAQPPAIMPSSQEAQAEQRKEEPIPAGAPAPRPEDEAAAIWSPWNGTCQHFASSQPCKDGQVIGFESRECIAKDPLACKGPFFRYCTLPC